MTIVIGGHVIALKYHPDTASAELLRVSDVNAKFLEISEAWRVLSKVETRRNYDSERMLQSSEADALKGINRRFVPGIPSTGDSTVLYHRNNYESSLKGVHQEWDSSRRDKYRNHKWLNLPLDQRKIDRAIPIETISGSAKRAIIPVVVFSILSFGIYSFSGADRRINKRTFV